MGLINKPVIDVKEYLVRINRLLKSSGDTISDKLLEEIDYNIKEIEKVLNYQSNNEIIPEKLREQIKQILPGIEMLKKNLDKRNKSAIVQSFSKLIENYSLIFKVHLAYLLRHPEPDEASYGDKPARYLVFNGVKQAKEFSERLAELVLLSPEPVNLLIYTSKNKRAHLFADIVTRMMKKDIINKKVNLYFNEEEVLTNEFVAGPLKKYLTEKYGPLDKKKIIENFKNYFGDWLMNSKEKGFFCSKITEFINAMAKREHENELTITLMFTHLPNIVCYFDSMGLEIEKAFDFKPAGYISWLDGNLARV